mgnify:CR=1 FL=1
MGYLVIDSFTQNAHRKPQKHLIFGQPGKVGQPVTVGQPSVTVGHLSRASIAFLLGYERLLNTNRKSRFIDVIGDYPGYGSSLMNRIISNAKANGKKYVNLKAVTTALNNKNAESYPLVKWYKSKGFVKSGPLIKNEYLLPMRHTIR